MMPGGELNLLGHSLLAVDADGGRCACGERFPLTQFIDHLGEVALAALDAPLTAEEARQVENRAAYERRLARDAADRLVVTRRVLDGLQAEHAAKWAQLEATGLTRFTDRDEWLRAHRTADEIRADRLSWVSRIEQATLADVIQFPRPMSRTQEERRTA